MKKQTKIFISIIIGLILLPIVLFLAWLLFMNIGTGESPASLEEIALVSPDNQRVVIAQTLAAQPNLGGVRVLQEKYKAEVIIHLDCSLLDTP